MALPISIDSLLSGTIVEGERIECKSGWNPEATLHTICAFANDLHNWGGGYLLIGIAEKNGRPQLPPVGISVDQIDEIQKELLNICHRIQPAYFPVVEPVVLDGKHVLIIWAPGGQVRPYKAPVSLAKHEKNFAYFVRVAASSVIAKGAIEQELMQLAATVPFDDRTNYSTGISDLQLRLIQAHLQAVGSELFEMSGRLKFRQLCWQMQIVDGPTEDVHPKNVGLLFFNDQPDRFFPTAWIDIVYLPSPDGANMREKSFRGPLDVQLRAALGYIREQFVEEAVVKRSGQAESDRFYTYPYEAIEEALANAVYHRGYDIREPIEVRITPSDITITSYPGPDTSISLAALHSGVIVARRYRNRRIGEFLKELRLTEGRGTGIPRILHAMQSNGSPPPHFDTDQMRSFFSVTLPIHPQADQGGRLNSYPEFLGLSELQENPRLAAVLMYCRNPHTRDEIMKHVSLKSVKAIREGYIQPLLRLEFLAYTRPDSPTAKNQAYRTTDIGRRALLAAGYKD